MLRITKHATQVAAAETHEDSRRTAMVAFALEGIKYLVYLKHHL